MELYPFDDDYVRRLQEGDRWTEEHFVRYFSELLLLKLRSRVRTLAALDDIRQEVFARVFRTLRAPDGLRDGRKLGAFVNSVCNNVLLESFRANGRVEPLADDVADVLKDPAPEVEERLVTGETKARVRSVIEQLQPKDAAILRAIFFEERDKDEVCRELGVDRDYLRVLLHRAKERFRSEYVSASNVAPFRQRETEAGKPSLRS